MGKLRSGESSNAGSPEEHSPTSTSPRPWTETFSSQASWPTGVDAPPYPVLSGSPLPERGLSLCQLP